MLLPNYLKKIICGFFILALAFVPSLPAFAEGEYTRSENPPMNETEFIIKFKEDVPLTDLEALIEKVEIKQEDYMPATDTYIVKVPEDKTVEEMVELYDDNQYVEYAEPDYIVRAFDEPNDPYFEDQYALATMSVPDAWDITSGSSSIVVAVVDTGVYSSHSDLSGRILSGYDFVNGDSKPTDDDGHGTMLAGIIAANTNNGIGVAGAAYGCKILPVKVLDNEGSGYISDVADGIIYAADKGADVINLSLGMAQSSRALQDAIEYAADKGVIIVAASGNENTAVCYPAAYSDVIAVGAVDEDDDRSSYSCYGLQLDFVAPGDYIYSTYYNGGYDCESGTSFSSPYVAALAALILDMDPDLSQAEVREIMEAGAVDLGSSGWDKYYGHGRIDFYESLLYMSQPTNAEAPEITTQPVATTVNVGENASLSIEATGSGTLTYQWYSGTSNSTSKGSAIDGATESTYEIPTDSASSRYYYCKVTNTDETARGSKTATTTSKAVKVVVKALTYAAAPVIKTQPSDLTICVGDSAKLYIKATGKKLTYQWYSSETGSTDDGVTIDSANSSKYYPSTEEEGTSYYYCIITNTDSNATATKTATATSDIATVVVEPVVDAEAPTISSDPEDVSMDVGQTMSLSVSATGTGKLTYQWYSNTTDSNSGGTRISKATKASYSLKQTKTGTKYYYCVVTNTDKTATGAKTATTTSDVATVVVNALVNAEDPTIITQPQAVTTSVGGSATLSIEATGTGTLTYQWYCGSKNSASSCSKLSSATGTTYTIPTSKAGTKYYYCLVTNTDSGVSGAKTATASSVIVKVVVN